MDQKSTERPTEKAAASLTPRSPPTDVTSSSPGKNKANLSKGSSRDDALGAQKKSTNSVNPSQTKQKVLQKRDGQMNGSPQSGKSHRSDASKQNTKPMDSELVNKESFGKGDKQGRFPSQPSANKMERNFTKKMERGGLINSEHGSKEEPKKKLDPKKVKILKKSPSADDKKSGQNQEDGKKGVQAQAGKGSGKKKNVERKPLGKLVITNLRKEEEMGKGKSAPGSPQQADQSQQDGGKNARTGRPSRGGEGEGGRGTNPPLQGGLDGGTGPGGRGSPETEEEEPWKLTMAEQEGKLEKTDIYKLTKKSLKFPRALYYCRLCNYHIDTLPQCWIHIDQSRHNRLAKAKESENFFRNLPVPSASHAKALTDLLKEVEEEHALTNREMKERAEVARRVEDILHHQLPDVLSECKVKLYGSSLSSFGFHDSDVNLDVEVHGEKQASKILAAVSKSVAARVDKDFRDFEADFEGKHPCVRFKDIETGLVCEIGTTNQHAVQCSQLLAEYTKHDGRLRPLAIGLRYWARLCGIDQQAIGALPAHTFIVLAIYFLQQCDPPILPIVQEKEQLKTKNKKSVGELWIDMLKFYLVGINIEEVVISIRQREPISRGDLKLQNRRIAIEDPFAHSRKNVAKSLTTSSVFQYIMDRFHDALKYFGIPQRCSPVSPSPAGGENPPNGLGAAPSEKPTPVSPTDSCKDRALTDADSSDTGDCSGETKEKVAGEAEGENGDAANDVGAKLAEMVLSELELEASVSRTDNLPNAGEKNDPTRQQNHTTSETEEENRDSHNPSTNCENVAGSRTSSQNGEAKDSITPPGEEIQGEDKLDSNPPITSAFKPQEDGSVQCKPENSERSSISNHGGDGSDRVSESLNDLCNDVVEKSSRAAEERKASDEEEEQYCFTFDKEILTQGETVKLICTGCLKQGHVNKNCPDDTLPPLKPLPRMDPKFLHYGTMICEEILKRNQPSMEDMRHREMVMRDLEYHIRQFSFKMAQLSLFGSSGNGFGFRNSDLDICLTFKDAKDVKGIEVTFVVEELAACLKRHRSFFNIVPIPTAKVPIVKFVHRPTRLEGDISLYNTLAQCNTRLLRAYSVIDRRAQVLGYAMKFFAKYCDIGDASRGSLSSYAYTLLTIYFLQQRKPPVLPVLQELYEGKEQPVHEVDGCNAWFFDNLDQLPRMWKGQFKNTESVGSLWLGMLRFYTEEFDFTKYVVSIRQHQPLTRFEKLWMTPQRGMAIEDPFDLDHNLGGAASKKMAIYIIQVFRYARDIFGTPRNFPPRAPLDLIMNYFLNVEALTGGEPPPNDRGCRICGKIGHFVKDCPVKKKEFDRKEQKKREWERRDKHGQQSPQDMGTPPRGPARDQRGTDSPKSVREDRPGKQSETKQGNTPSSNRETSSVSEKQRSVNKTEEKRTKARPYGDSEKTVESVARQLYPVKPVPVKPIPVKKGEAKTPAGEEKARKEQKQTAPSSDSKPPGSSAKETLRNNKGNPTVPLPNPHAPHSIPSPSPSKKGGPERGKDQWSDGATARKAGGDVGIGGADARNNSQPKQQQNQYQQQQHHHHQQQARHPSTDHPMPNSNQSIESSSTSGDGTPGGPTPAHPPSSVGAQGVAGGPSPNHGHAGSQFNPFGGSFNFPFGSPRGPNMPPPEVLKSMIQQQQQQQQQQQNLANLFQMIGKQPPQGSPLQNQAPTQGPMMRPPTTPVNAHTVDEIEQQLKMKQQQNQQQQVPRLLPGAKTIQQIEQQMKQDQFFQSKEQSAAGWPQQREAAGKQQVGIAPQQGHGQHQLGRSGQSSRVIGTPPGMGFRGKRDSESEAEEVTQQQQQQHLPQSQSQPIPIDPRRGQQAASQWPGLGNSVWGSSLSTAISPPSPHYQQHGAFPPSPQQSLATSPPHNLLRSPPGVSTPPPITQYFNPGPFGPSVLPSGFSHHQPQQGASLVGALGWAQPAGGMQSSEEQARHWQGQGQGQGQGQHGGEPSLLASAGSPRSPDQPGAGGSGPTASHVQPRDAQLQQQVQQVFGPPHQVSPSSRNEYGQAFHFSPHGLNPSLPRSSHSHTPQSPPMHLSSTPPHHHHHQGLSLPDQQPHPHMGQPLQQHAGPHPQHHQQQQPGQHQQQHGGQHPPPHIGQHLQHGGQQFPHHALQQPHPQRGGGQYPHHQAEASWHHQMAMGAPISSAGPTGLAGENSQQDSELLGRFPPSNQNMR